MSDFFISYNAADFKKAEWIAWILREAGYLVRFAPWEIGVGGDIAQWMERALQDCRAMICVASPDYLKPQAKYSALERAAMLWQDVDGKERRLIFVKVRPCALPVIFGPRLFLDFEGASRDDAKEKLLAGAKPPAIPNDEPEFGDPPQAVASSAEPDFKAPPLQIDLSALPDTSLVTLRGRETDLVRLDDAWGDPSIHVFSVVAWGGQGKTALVSTWVDRLKGDGGRGAEAMLAWSFYSQGSKERTTTADRFLDWALKKLGLPDPGPSATLKAEKIAEALQRRRVLLILDGLEPLQHGPGPQEGLLKDPAMRALLRRTAADGVGGLILLTTRLPIQDISGRRNGAAPVLDLRKLSDEAGAALLEDRGVHGPDSARRAAATEFGGHALALTLLSGFLVKRHGGDIHRRDCVGPMVASERELNPIHAHARRVMHSMDEEWLREAPLHAAIMRVIGLFDRPASADCLEALRKGAPLAGLEPWRKADTNARADAIFELRSVGLLLARDPQSPDSLDAHPLAREWYGEKFRQENEAGWKAAHSRLYDHLRRTTREGDNPDLASLEPLFQAIAHGCRAERQLEALKRLYQDRICRYEFNGAFAYYAIRSQGAFGPCLAGLAWFFKDPFEDPDPKFGTEDRGWLFGEVGFVLRGLGRFEEARRANSASLECFKQLGKSAEVNQLIRNISEIDIVLGEIGTAKRQAEEAVRLADRANNEDQALSRRANYAATLHASGDRKTARAMFETAETRLKSTRNESTLYAQLGFLYCDYLLDERKFADVIDRGVYSLSISQDEKWLQTLGQDYATLGRAALGLALSESVPCEARGFVANARNSLRTAVNELRRSNMIDILPAGLLARARLCRAEADFDGARRDLDEVLEIAEPAPMRLHLCDMHLELCRLALAERDGFAPLAAAPPPPATGDARDALTATARAALDQAAALIEQCGYHRRDTERDELSDVLTGNRLFRDLPIHV